MPWTLSFAGPAPGLSPGRCADPPADAGTGSADGHTPAEPADLRQAERHVAWMRRALALAERARGFCSPNPAVGAVIVRDGQVVGEGWTQPPGQAHAEIVALRQAGEAARGATLYVTLEPCAHHGRTPPCTRAIVEAGIVEVHAAVGDPNPLVAGAGFRQLAAAGVRVVVGACADAATELNEAFFKHITTGRPFVTAKWAMTLDGKIATRTGDSRWISGGASRRLVHRWRAVGDAVMVGIGTALADDPELTARDVDGPVRQPLRIVVDSRARLPLTAKLLSPALAAGTLVAVADPAGADLPRDERRAFAARVAALEAAGAEVWRLPVVYPGEPARAVTGRTRVSEADVPASEGGARADEAGAGQPRVDLGALFERLGARGITSVLLEGGGELIAAALAGGHVDKVCVFVAPKLFGGRAASGPVGGEGVARVADAVGLRLHRVEPVGEDMLIVAYPAGGVGDGGGRAGRRAVDADRNAGAAVREGDVQRDR